MSDFDEFFRASYPAVVRALAVGFGDRGEAEDAAQEGFTRAFMRWPHVAAMDDPRAWVYVVAVRSRLRAWKRADRIGTRAAVVETQSSAADPAVLVGDRRAILDALQQLPDRQRLAIVLRYGADLSVRDVASAMRCAEGTVKATLHQALRAIHTRQASPAEDGS